MNNNFLIVYLMLVTTIQIMLSFFLVLNSKKANKKENRVLKRIKKIENKAKIEETKERIIAEKDAKKKQEIEFERLSKIYNNVDKYDGTSMNQEDI